MIVKPEMESLLQHCISIYKTHHGNFDKYNLVKFKKMEFSHMESYFELEIDFINFLFFGFRQISTMNAEISFKKEILKIRID